MVNFQIDFDHPDKKYFPGELIQCTVKLDLSSAVTFRSIYVRYKGFAKVEWVESETQTRDGKSHTEHVTYRDEEEYFTSYETLAGSRNGKY